MNMDGRTSDPNRIAVVEAFLGPLVPAAGLLGIVCEGAGERWVRLVLPYHAPATNHVGTVYAGAVFVLAESAATCLLASSLRFGVIPVVVAATATLARPAKEDLVAEAELPLQTLDAWMTALDVNATGTFDLDVHVTDRSGSAVADIRLTYRFLVAA